MPSTLLNCGDILPEFFKPFLHTNLNLFSPVEHSICHILGTVGPIDVKQKGNESAGCYADQGTFDLDLWPWPWLFKVKLYVRNGRPDCHGTKGIWIDRMPWCETLKKWVNWMLRWLRYLWRWIFKGNLYLGNGRPDCHGTKGTGFDMMPWCETLRKCMNWTLHLLWYLWPWPLTFNFQGQIISPEWEALLLLNERDSLDMIPWCETLKGLSQHHAALTRVRVICLWPWIFKLYLRNRRPDCHGMKGMGVDRMSWCKTQPLWGYC